MFGIMFDGATNKSVTESLLKSYATVSAHFEHTVESSGTTEVLGRVKNILKSRKD